MTDDEMKAFVDVASYQQLLFLHRFEPIGSGWFEGDMGKYFYKRFDALHEITPSEQRVAASKAVGW